MRRSRGARNTTTRAQLDQIVNRLNLPVEWSIEELIAGVTELRGRPIELVPMIDDFYRGRHVCGWWFAYSTYDVIMHRQSSDAEHQKGIIAHEVSHMVLGHQGDPELTVAAGDLATTLTGVDPRLLETDCPEVHARGWAGYNDENEYAAELMARLIATQASRTTRPGDRLRDRGLRIF